MRFGLLGRAFLALLGILLISSAALFALERLEGGEPSSLRTRVEALSFEPLEGWRVASGEREVLAAALADAGVGLPADVLDDLGVGELTRALAFLVTDGAVSAAARVDFIPASGLGDPVGIRDAALLSLELDGDPTLERFEGGSDDLPYAGYRAGEGISRRSVLFVSFVPGIVRMTILAPDATADLLIATIAYDPPPAPDASASPSSSP